jgi:hypothetical protein
MVDAVLGQHRGLVEILDIILVGAIAGRRVTSWREAWSADCEES